MIEKTNQTWVIAITIILLTGFTFFFKFTQSSENKYDYYAKVNYSSCSSEFEKKPMFSMKFDYRKETNEIFMTLENKVAGEEKIQSIKKLSPCEILDNKNWTCGGDLVGTFFAPKYTLVEGNFSFVDSYSPPNYPCPTKIVKH